MKFHLLTAACLALATTTHANVEVVCGPKPGQKKGDKALTNEPFSVDFDAAGNMYGVEWHTGNRVFKVTPEGKLDFVAGAFSVTAGSKAIPAANDGPADKAQFHAMHDIDLNSKGEAFIADTFANRIRKLNLKTGEVTTIAGGDGSPGYAGDGGPFKDAKFNQAYCGYLSADENVLYVADLGNSRVRALDLVKGTISTVAGSGKKGAPVEGANALETPLNGPRACAVGKDGTLYIALREGNSLLSVKDGKLSVLVNPSGKKGSTGDGGPGIDALLNGPKYLCMDPQDNVIIVDTESHTIRRYDPKTKLIHLVAGIPGKKGPKVGSTLLETQLDRPHGVRFDSQNRIYIADSENHRVVRAEYKINP